jgi:FtsH-binding integral membrane protein
MNGTGLTAEQIQVEQANFITKVYAWMSLALLVTGLVAIATASSRLLTELIF